MEKMADGLKARFRSYTKKSGACLIWTGYRDKDGYGRFRVDDRKFPSHRISYLLYKGDIPSGVMVCHTCDNPPCVDPDHLFLGTAKDNARDMWAKDRQSENNPFRRQKDQKECKYEHPFSNENTYLWRGHRRCKICHRSRVLKYYHRSKNGKT